MFNQFYGELHICMYMVFYFIYAAHNAKSTNSSALIYIQYKYMYV